MSEIKLLPCPFCGGEAKFITGSPFIWEHAVACSECGTATRMIGGVTPSMARDRVAKVWNTRKPMQEIVERLEEMEYRFGDLCPNCAEKLKEIKSEYEQKKEEFLKKVES